MLYYYKMFILTPAPVAPAPASEESVQRYSEEPVKTNSIRLSSLLMIV